MVFQQVIFEINLDECEPRFYGGLPACSVVQCPRSSQHGRFSWSIFGGPVAWARLEAAYRSPGWQERQAGENFPL